MTLPSGFGVFMRRSLISAALFFSALFSATVAQAGYAHLVMDAKTGKVLSANHADTLNYPASLTKMMTLYMTFEALHQGRLTWNSKITMTKRGARVVPLKLGVRAGDKITVREAVLGMIVLSANDAAEAMCDRLAGRKTSCGAMLTRKAHALGMKRTTFRNGSGLPDRRQRTTARDMARLGMALKRDYPKEYKLFATRSFKFRGRTIHGHNRLMYRYTGMDGIKTGFTNASGFNIVTAVSRGGRELVGVVMGGRTASGRDRRMAALLDKALPKASKGRNPLLPTPAREVDPVLTASLGPVPLPSPRAYQQIEDPLPVATNPGRWKIQIAAVDTRDAAMAMLMRARAADRGALGRAIAQALKVERNGTAFYRARFSGFDSRDVARNACKSLTVLDFKCFVVGSSG
ncbi:MAG TPA: D-alanyl-D-alanine carboxypeptidase family protein [Ensifer sp.]|nr:D-alanyl-D-alanine carboxypeptidase family protein [Ensifer sp.]